jgi:hypothetical protein
MWQSTTTYVLAFLAIIVLPFSGCGLDPTLKASPTSAPSLQPTQY